MIVHLPRRLALTAVKLHFRNPARTPEPGPGHAPVVN